MDILNIENSLKSTFSRHRLVFWYDAKGEWRDAFMGVSEDIATKLEVDGNEFGVKVRVLQDDPDTRYLFYLPSARPQDDENWLLDLLMQGHEYTPDKTTFLLNECGLPQEFRHIVEAHAVFFKSAQRVVALRDLLTDADDADDIRIKMMAVLAKCSAQINEILLHLLASMDWESLIDPVAHLFDSAHLTAFFWSEVERLFGYQTASPSLRDFAVSLFRSANPLEKQIKLRPHATVFLQQWKDRNKYRGVFEKWSALMQEQLHIEQSLSESEQGIDLGDADTFELFEKYTLHQLCTRFTQGLGGGDLQHIIKKRRQSFWWEKYSDGYAAVEHAVKLRELLSTAELRIDSPASGFNQYADNWWQIDSAYRRCIRHLRKYGQVQLMQEISGWVEDSYVYHFLVRLADLWTDQVRGMKTWTLEGVTPQRQFFQKYVQPFRNKKQKVIVIISDALRYEAARELAEQLHTQKIWDAEVEAMAASLPSYTQLGMASLLPVEALAMEPETKVVFADANRTDGLENRRELIKEHCEGNAAAMNAEEFLELNTTTQGRPLMRENDIIYVFHNVIDKTGDDLKTEAKTFEAVETAFRELAEIIRKAANINANNILLTADHGFLFQQEAANSLDDIPLPPAREWSCITRRFALGQDVSGAPGIMLFDAAALGLEGNWTAAFPGSIGRFPVKGSGKRFLHGGFALQEAVVPVIKLHKARVDETRQVEVVLQNAPSMATTGQLSLTLFQREPVGGKVLPCTLIAGVYAADDTALSEVKELTFDSSEPEARQRESKIVLTLSGMADRYNNKTVEIRLARKIPGTSQTQIYKTHNLKIQKRFTSDFDE